MSLDQGQTDAAAFAVPPQRTPVEFDPESNGLRIGPYERRIADPSDPDQVFGAYLSLLYAVRGAEPGEQLKLRSADLEALLLIVGDDPETIEQRLIALMGCTAQEARVLGSALLRHRRLTATLGIAGALAMGGAIAGDELFDGSREASRAAVVQSVAEGLRALDDAGASRGSVSFAVPSSAGTSSAGTSSAVSPASVTMPADDWTGSKPVGGSPDVPAGTPAAAGGGAPAPAAPAVDVPAAAPAAEAPAVAPPAAPPVVPAPVPESSVEQPSPATPTDATTPVDTTTPVVDDGGVTPPGLGGNGMPGAIDVLPDLPPVVPVGVTPPLPPLVVPPAVDPAIDPTVHDNRDKLKNSNNGNDSDAADRDDNGKHGRTGQHVENGNNSSNSAGGVVP